MLALGPNAKVTAAAAAMAEVHCAWLGRCFAERLGSRLARPRLASRRIDAVADFKTCDQHGEYKKRAQRVVRDIGGSDENRGEDERARRDENQNLEKPPENRPQQDAPDQ